MALYVYVIKNTSGPEQSWMPLFKAAEKCQNQIKFAAEKESFSQKCSKVLDELHAEATSHIQRAQNPGQESGQQNSMNDARNRRSDQPQYSEQFATISVDTSSQHTPRIPEFTYGADWQDMNFVSTCPSANANLVN